MDEQPKVRVVYSPDWLFSGEPNMKENIANFVAEIVDRESDFRDWRERIADPDWQHTELCHDWKNHVPDVFREIWHDLPELARMCIFLMAHERAGDENWD